MEGMVMLFNNIYKGKNVLVTGHTGFKGSWLAYWLTKLGANVTGAALPPVGELSHYELLKLYDKIQSFNLDLRQVVNIPENTEIVFHLAAQAIVAKTFEDPRGTFESNVMGAVNILEACRQCSSVKAVVMITTDKVYSNKEWGWGYRENDELGGLDPYSASKVCVEHVIECYRSQFIPMIATARAGNVIGGGDWAYKRLIPDIMKATAKRETVEIHTPHATRPWQHVLEPLAGYLTLGQKLLEGETWAADRWNFGPEGEMTVLEVVKIAQGVWPQVKFKVKEEETHPSMVQLLKIDSTESRRRLGWRPVWSMLDAIIATVSWYENFYKDGFISTNRNIEDYCATMEDR